MLLKRVCLLGLMLQPLLFLGHGLGGLLLKTRLLGRYRCFGLPVHLLLLLLHMLLCFRNQLPLVLFGMLLRLSSQLSFQMTELMFRWGVLHRSLCFCILHRTSFHGLHHVVLLLLKTHLMVMRLELDMRLGLLLHLCSGFLLLQGHHALLFEHLLLESMLERFDLLSVPDRRCLRRRR